MSGLRGLSIKASKNSLLKPLNITIRVAAGLTAMTLLLINIAVWLHLVPSADKNIVEERRVLTESMAITYSGLMQLNETQQIQPILAAMIQRTPGLLSAGIRDKDGHLITSVGDHDSQWTNRTGNQSTDTQMKVPLFTQNGTAGEVEFRFAPITPKTVLGFLHDDISGLFAFIIIGGFLIYGSFVWVILRKVLTMKTSEAIPKRIRDSLNTLAEGILILDKQMRIVLANDAFARLLGHSPQEVEGQPISQLPWVKPEGNINPYPWDQSMTTGSAYTGVLLGLKGELATASLSVNSTPIRGVDNTHRGTMISIDNLSKIEKKNRQLQRLTERLKNSRVEIQKKNTELEFLAYRDPMTKCLNRRSFFEQLNVQWNATRRYHYPLSCIMLDIDHFKSVNDTHGHAVGDEVIKHIANHMEACRRESDIVARLGGEEFVMLLPHTTADQAVLAAERIRKSVESSPCSGISVTISLGVAQATDEIKEANTLLNQADKALYASKHGGRNRVSRWDMLSEEERQDEPVKKDGAPEMKNASVNPVPSVTPQKPEQLHSSQ